MSVSGLALGSGWKVHLELEATATTVFLEWERVQVWALAQRWGGERKVRLEARVRG